MSDSALDHERGEGNGVAGEHLVGVHHIGVPVRDLDRSLSWYREIFGFHAEIMGTSDTPETSRMVQVDDVRLRFAFLQLPNTMLELLEYKNPVGADFKLRNCDVGAIHVCFEVDDIEQVYESLTERGVPFSIEPTALSGPLDGHACCYFRDPDGVQLEIWQRP